MSNKVERFDADSIDPTKTVMLYVRQKKPSIVKALQITQPFLCTTLSGLAQGKTGDYLIIDENGNRSVMDRDVFNDMYEIAKEVPAELEKPSFRDAIARAVSKGPIRIDPTSAALSAMPVSETLAPAPKFTLDGQEVLPTLGEDDDVPIDLEWKK